MSPCFLLTCSRWGDTRKTMYVCTFGSALEERWVAHCRCVEGSFATTAKPPLPLQQLGGGCGVVLEYHDVKGINGGTTMFLWIYRCIVHVHIYICLCVPLYHTWITRQIFSLSWQQKHWDLVREAVFFDVCVANELVFHQFQTVGYSHPHIRAQKNFKTTKVTTKRFHDLKLLVQLQFRKLILGTWKSVVKFSPFEETVPFCGSHMLIFFHVG